MENKERRRQRNRKYYLKKKRADERIERKVLLSSRVPEWIMARLQLMAQEGLVKGTYECRTVGEAVQYVLKLGFKALKDEPDVGDSMKYVEAKSLIDKIRRQRKDGMVLLHEASVEVSEMLSVNDKDGALRCFNVAIEAMRDLPPTTWGDKAIEQFQAKYPELNERQKKGKIPYPNLITRALEYGARMDERRKRGVVD